MTEGAGGAVGAPGAHGASGGPGGQRASGTAAVDLPAPVLFEAPADWRAIDFVSDLHLCDAMPATCAAFEAYIEHTAADAVFILGDLFELWVGDDARHEPFARRCVLALAGASRRRTVAIMSGNRDFLMGEELFAACGARALRDPTLLAAFGQQLLLTHGDALCLDDRDYQAFRRQVRAPAWLASFLARPLAERLAFAREIRRASETRRQFDGEGAADVDASAACDLLRAAGAAALVHGHTHRPGSESWPGGLARHVLSDWDLDSGARAEVLRLTASGLRRLRPGQAAADPA